METKKINITKEQTNNLSKELAKITFNLMGNESVECIYFIPYVSLDENEETTIYVTIVGDYAHLGDLEQRLSEYNVLHQSQECVDKYTSKIELSVDDSRNYTSTAASPAELARLNYLSNSTILYDKTGKCTRIKKKAEKRNLMLENYTASFYPPIEDDIRNAIENEILERDTTAVKDFINSEAFKIIKHM